MDDRTALIEDVCRHVDLSERLSLLPPASRVRGVFFRSIEIELTRAGRMDRYRSVFPERFGSVSWQPMREFLVRLTAGGALLAGPEHVHQGMHAIGRRNATVFADSLLGRALLRLLSRDPKKLLQQALAGRRQSMEPGRWTLTFPEERTAEMSMTEEYLYIDSYLLGAAQGTFDAVGIPVRAEASMDSRTSGRHILRW